jgi:hypothetical protein
MKFDDFLWFDLLACSREFGLVESLQHIEILVACTLTNIWILKIYFCRYNNNARIYWWMFSPIQEQKLHGWCKSHPRGIRLLRIWTRGISSAYRNTRRLYIPDCGILNLLSAKSKQSFVFWIISLPLRMAISVWCLRNSLAASCGPFACGVS